jgi:GNAT superfamily N-acetyltransferase
MLTRDLREYAETPDRFSHIASGRSVTRFADEQVCVLQGATWASVSGVRVDADEVASLLAKVRALVPPEKEPVWWIGPSATPSNLYDRLLELGLREPSDRVTRLCALALDTEPAPGPADADVRIVDSYEDFVATREVQWEAFGTPRRRRENERRLLPEIFAETRTTQLPVWFLAVADGRPAAAALAVPSDRGVFLIGGATAPWARGRGLYRALVRARWDYAVERGTPAVVVHADPRTSYPILRKLGFEEVCAIRRLEDPAGDAA